MARKPFDVNKSWIKLILAMVLLNCLILAAFLTSTPQTTPASEWLTLAFQARYKLAPVADKKQLYALHLDSGKEPKAQCVACHGTMLNSSVTLHRIHLTSDLLIGLACHDCHQRIDLTPRGDTVYISWVNVAFCKKCHSRFPGLNPGSPMQPNFFNEDCTTCHSGDHTPAHAQPYLTQIIAPSECKGCHGGRVLPWQPGHDLPTWLKIHGQTALTVGTQTCFKCHDFGLKFCDNCHKIKPPSHLPRDQWLVTHPASAQADTRVCFTCHQANFCKTCHINHQPNWLHDHPATVQASGSTQCMRCHSQSFCSSCHASGVAPGGSAPTTTTP